MGKLYNVFPMEILLTHLEGNRLLSNVEKIEAWMKQVHKIHEEKGMGWVSPYGCPEDGQQAYDSRGKCLEKLTKIVDSINSNFDG